MKHYIAINENSTVTYYTDKAQALFENEVVVEFEEPNYGGVGVVVLNNHRPEAVGTKLTIDALQCDLLRAFLKHTGG